MKADERLLFLFYRVYKAKKILAWLRQSYATDLRALSLMRIGIALVVIADLCIRLCDLSAHYTDAGIWPTRLVYSFGSQPGFWSLHALSGSFHWQLILFILHFFSAVCLLLGYRTKLATLMVWLLLISLHNRNVFVLQAGDDLLRLVLLWGLFLPWNAHYSWDAKQYRTSKQSALANLGYLLLLSSVYFFTVNLKSGDEWHRDSSAVYFALSLEQLRLPLGDWLYQFPAMMSVLTKLVFYTELLIPFLILIPSKKGSFRFAAFILILILQISIGLSLYVGLFFIISIVAAFGLLPKFFIDPLEKWFRLKTKPLSKLRPVKFQIAKDLACSLIIIFCLIINLSAFTRFDYKLRSELVYITNVIRLNQYWGMFSPNILKKDGWFVYHGFDSLGRQWDLRTNKEYVVYSKPDHIVDLYKNDRWRKLGENLQSDNNTFLRPLFCNFLLHEWNQEHPHKQMSTLYLYFMEKENLPDYKTKPIIKQLYCVCNGN